MLVRKINGFKIRDAFTDEVVEDIGGEGLGYLTPRYNFDKELAKLAVGAGAELLLPGTVPSAAFSQDDVQVSWSPSFSLGCRR